MSVVAREQMFPANVIKLIADRAVILDDPQPLDPVEAKKWTPLKILQRPIRTADGIQAIGVFPDTWRPNDQSFEMSGLPEYRSHPTLSTYYIGIHAMVRDTDEERGQANHAELANRVLAMLDSDGTLRSQLGGLSATSITDQTIRLKRFGVESMKYLAREMKGSWYFLTSIRFYAEVETV